MPQSNLPAGYKPLLNKVKQTLILGQQRIEAEKVRTYWETGRLIHADILKHARRAGYGAEVIKRLARDLNIHPRLLHRCVQFAKAYPRRPIVSARTQFTWAHYRELMAIPDQSRRSELEDAAGRNNWTSRELAARVKGRKTFRLGPPAAQEEPPPKQDLLIPKRGELYTYRLVQRPLLGGRLEEAPVLLDLGFGMYKRLGPRMRARFGAGQIVESDYDAKEEEYSLRASGRTAKDLFTYQAVIERVVDADTLKVRVDLGFGLEHRETLRLRDIDAPEVGTKAGDAARTFAQSLLKEADTIILYTTRSDKYDRYLADVFIESKTGGEDIFLSNLLLENGYANRV
jgi:endonuclease YncB( thermonuclease family)